MSNLVVGQIQGLSANGNVVTVPSGHTIRQSGSLLQVRQTSLNTRQVYSSISTWTALSGLSVSITPKFSNSSILLSTTFACSTGADTTTAFRWHRSISGGSSGYLPYGTGYSTDWDAHFKSGSSNNGYWQVTTSHQLLDSPGTTSAITYSIHFRPYDSGRTFYFNGASDASANADRSYCVPTITAMEIAQ